MRRRLVVGLFLAGMFSVQAWAAPPAAKPDWPPAKPEAIEAWKDMRFGMFIHWGPVSLTCKEIGWSRGGPTPIDVYDNLYKKFNPAKFNADQWVSVAKAAGMKYMVLTTKHHDGFCLWDTKLTDYNIMNSPFHRDVVKELAEACKKQGMKFGAYYSVTDWYHPGWPVTSPAGRVQREKSDMDAYEKYLQGQIRELITNYGPLVTIWNDVSAMYGKERGAATIRMVRELQPDITINNRTGAGGDYDTPEQHIGGFNTARPWESCMTVSAHNHWAWGGADDGVKDLATCLKFLIFAAGGDGNMLLNVGPTPEGEIAPEQAARIKEMGDWLAKYGESIYATRGGPYKPTRTLASTHKDNTVYLHVLAWEGEKLVLPNLGKKIVKSELLTGGAVDVKQDGDVLTITVAKADQQPIDTIVNLELDGPAKEIAPISLRKPGLIKPTMKATASITIGKEYAPAKAIDGDDSTRWATPGGTKEAWLEIDLGQPTTFARAEISEAFPGRVKSFELQYKDGDAWKTFHKGKKLGAEFEATFKPVTAQVVRLTIHDAKDGPTINEVQLLAK